MSESNEPTMKRTVEVVAPSDLNGGYELYVLTGNNTSCRIRVPAGGVLRGHRFEAIVIPDELPSGPHRIPFGRWRDGIFDCCSLGLCHPVLCLTTFCSLCGLGQVLTRMNLNCIGSPRTSPEVATVSAFMVMFAISVLHYVAQGVVGKFFWIVQLFAALLGIVVTMRLRAYVRDRYSIPARFAEDFFCSLCCMPCTICQMSRHTADFRKYGAGCCTENGLNEGDPDPV